MLVQAIQCRIAETEQINKITLFLSQSLNSFSLNVMQSHRLQTYGKEKPANDIHRKDNIKEA